MTTWGSYTHGSSVDERVGYDGDRSPDTITHSTTEVVYTFTFKVDSNIASSDQQSFDFSGTFNGEPDKAFTVTGGVQTVATKTKRVTLSYSSSPTFNVGMTANGVFNGTHPTVSGSVTVPKRPAAAPDPPAAPTVSSVGKFTASASWGAPDSNGDSIDKYEVAWETEFGTNIRVVESGDRTDSVSGLDPWKNYTVKARAHNGEGWSAWGNKRSFRTDADNPGKMSAPETSLITATGLRIDYTLPSDGGPAIDLVQVATETAAGVPVGDTLNDTTLDPPAFTSFPTLTRSTDYRVAVRARNSEGLFGAWSNYTYFTTAALPPNAPTLAEPDVDSFSEVTLNWTPPSNDGGSPITGYRVERATNSGFTTGLVAVTVAPSTTYQFTGLAGSTQYWFRVYAINAAGEKASAVQTATTETAIVDATQAPQVSNLTAVSFQLRSLAGAYTRNWQVATDAGFTNIISNTTTSAEQTVIPTNPKAGTLRARYRLDSGAGYGAFSAAAVINVPKKPVRWDGTKWVDDIKYLGAGGAWESSNGNCKRWNGTAWV